MGTENGQCDSCAGPLILIDADEHEYECLRCGVMTVKITEEEIMAALETEGEQQ